MDAAEIKRLKAIKYDLENDFYYFCRYFFKQARGVKFIHNWHHELLAKTMQQVSAYDIGNVVVNIPPRYGKTQIAVIYWIAWCLAKNPQAEFIHLSYSDKLALGNSSKAKDIILSDEFQKFWPLKLKADAKSKHAWRTEEGGGMYAASAAGQVTGFGAGLASDAFGKPFGGAIIIDDPLKPEDARSKNERDKVNYRLVETIESRRNSSMTPIVIIMQRLHIEDMTGFVMNNGLNEAFHHIKIPAISLSNEGEETPLWPHKHSLQRLHDKRKNNGMVFAGQMMQEPVPEGGAMFKKDWLRYYTASADLSWKGFIPYILVDTSKGETLDSDYTAMIVVCTGSDENYYVVDIIRDRLNVTQRVEAAFTLHERWKAKTGIAPKIGYEEVGMMDDIFHLRKEMESRRYNMNLVKLGAVKKKIVRIAALVPEFENSRVYLPHSLVYIDVNKDRRDLITEFVNDEYLYYPVSARKDMLDALAKILEPDLAVRFPVTVAPQPKPLSKDNWQWGGGATQGNNNQKGWL